MRVHQENIQFETKVFSSIVSQVNRILILLEIKRDHP